MSIRWLIATLAVTAMAVFAASGSVADTSRDRTTFQGLEQQARDTLRAIRNYGFEHKDEYREKLQALLDKMDRQIEVLKRKAARAGEAARKKYEEQLAELRPLRDKVRARMKKI